jgi:hypothetical protein
LGNLSVDVKKISNWSLKRYGVRMVTGLIWLRREKNGGLF